MCELMSRWGCLFAFRRLCECLFERLLMCFCVCGWVLGVSWPAPLLSDWQTKCGSAAVIVAFIENCSRQITEHYLPKSQRGRKTKRVRGYWFKCFWRGILLAYAHSYINRGMGACVRVYNLAFFHDWWHDDFHDWWPWATAKHFIPSWVE